MIEKKTVEGNDKGDILIYALSTCGWCSRAKDFLRENNVKFCYIDTDLLNSSDKEDAKKELEKWNPNRSFPTIVINNETAIVGFQKDKLTEVIS